MNNNISWTQTEKLNAIRPKYVGDTNLAVQNGSKVWSAKGYKTQ